MDDPVSAIEELRRAGLYRQMRTDRGAGEGRGW